MKKTWLACLFALGTVLLFDSCRSCSSQKEQTEDIADDNDELFRRPDLARITAEIRQDPENASLYYERGNILHRLELDSLAIKDYKKAIRYDSARAEYYSAIGSILFDHKDISGSRSWLEKAISLDPEDPRAHLKYAKLLLFLKELNPSLQQINLVLRKDPYNPEGYFLKGMVYKDLKDTAKAISSFQTAINVAPDYKDAMVQLGQIYAALKDTLALKYYDNAFQLDTADVFPLFAKGVFFQKQGNFSRAKEQYRKCILYDRQYADAYYNLGFIYIAEDSVEKAYRQFDLITKISPADAEAYYQRGLCQEAMGRKFEAANDFKQALAFNKDYEAARKALSRVQK